MGGDRRRAGLRAERHAEAWLSARGYRTVVRNARSGRLEIDLVVRERSGLLVFCEVRARRRSRLGLHPAETVTPEKQRRIRRAAAGWLRAHPDIARTARGLRFDVLAVWLGPDGEPSDVEHFEAAF